MNKKEQCVHSAIIGGRMKEYQIFRECFTELPITQQLFEKLLRIENCVILREEREDELAGFSILEKNALRLLCVRPAYQGRGIGKKLVRRSEEYVHAQGYDEIVLGGVDSGLFLGAVLKPQEKNQGYPLFWKQLGYTAAEGCIEMKLALKQFNLEEQPVSLYPQGVKFEYYIGSPKQLEAAVAEVDEEWVQYFRYDDPKFVATRQGKIVGFAILCYDDENLLCDGKKKVGSIGCVGVIPKERGNGIGLAMVAYATQELKQHGCDEVLIHWTYLEKWYGKLGYRTFLTYWFGRKHLQK